MPAALSANLLTGLVSFLLTLMVLSYLIGDNPAFRVAVYIFVGVSAGYAASVAWHQVLWPRLFLRLLSGTLVERLWVVIPLVLGILLLMKLSPRYARLGNPSMAFLVGVGAAVAIGGAVLGTLFPQTQATFRLPSVSQVLADINIMLGNPSQPTPALEQFISGVFIIIGTITTLVYFQFGAKATSGRPERNRLIKLLSWVGQVFIAITFGALFAGVYTAAMTALIERLNFLWTFITSL